ncbi:MAG TPA: MFS transporter [Rhodanobacteraceae bacterium]|nr:MFS transporter [Rhodanobacteraceae bacterium]
MLRTLRPIASLLVSTAFLLASIGLLGTLIPLRGLAQGFSGSLIGALAGIYYAGFLVGTYVIPPLVRRIGHIRAFAFCAACAAIVALLHALASWPWLWLALRLTDGIMMVGLYTIVESWLNAQAPASHRGVVFAIYMMVNSGALALSQLLLRIDGHAFVLFTVVALLALAATLPVVLTRQAQPAPQSAPRLELRRLFGLAPTAGVGALLAGLAMGAFYGLAPVYARHIGFDNAGISTYMTLAILGGALMQWPLGYLSDRIDRRLALAIVGTAACVLAVCLWFVGGHKWAAIALIFAYCGMAFAIYPMVVAHLVDYLTPEELLAASASVYLLYGAGSALGPLLAGVAMQWLGNPMLPVWFALNTALLAVYATYRYRAFRREQVDENNFRPMLRTTSAVLEMMPEAQTSAGNAAD